MNFKSDEFGKDLKINIEHGTTTLGFVTNNGVILAVDSRATGGRYIGLHPSFFFFNFLTV